MSIPSESYARLIRASGARDSLSAVLWSLTENGAAWAALLSMGGQPLNSAARSSVDEVDPEVLADAFAALPRPITRGVAVTGPDGLVVMAFPVGAETRASTVLLVAFEGSVAPDLVRYGESAALMLGLIRRYRRQVQTASRTVRDSVVRLMLAGRREAAFDLAAEMGLTTPPTRPYVAVICGLRNWDGDDILDLLEAALPVSIRQILADVDPDECWMLLSDAQFQALKPEIKALIERNSTLRALVTEPTPTSKLTHRWAHWGAAVRDAAPGTWLDRSEHRGEDAGDMVQALQAASPRMVEAVVAYLRHRGRWEAAADSLEIHRNTLRYRVAGAEELLGVDLTDPTVSSLLWLALRNEGLVTETSAADARVPR